VKGIVLRRPVRLRQIRVDDRLTGFLAPVSLPEDRAGGASGGATPAHHHGDPAEPGPGGRLPQARRIVWPRALGAVAYGGRLFLSRRAFCPHRQGERPFQVERILAR